ncbi:enoyl-CoA hydratase [compost metagenome]
MAKTIANNSPMAISRAIKATNLSDTDKGFETEIKFFGELFDLDDKKEGVSAFIEKRKPNF